MLKVDNQKVREQQIAKLEHIRKTRDPQRAKAALEAITKVALAKLIEDLPNKGTRVFRELLATVTFWSWPSRLPAPAVVSEKLAMLWKKYSHGNLLFKFASFNFR